MTVSDVTESGIKEALKSLEPGWYLTTDLLPIYNEWAKRVGRVEVTAQILGQALRRDYSDAPVRRAHGHNARYLDQDILNHRAWFAPS